jgi:GMP synthase (glutamine-hydrolysing)
MKPALVVLSGSRNSVYDEDAPTLPEGLLEMLKDGTVGMVFGICFGQQRIAKDLGGTVKAADGTDGEYGPAKIHVTAPDHFLFKGLPIEQDVWESHGDSVPLPPPGFIGLANTETGVLAAMARDDNKIVTVQFHAEVPQTTFGKELLERIALHAGCEPDWEAQSELIQFQEKLRKLPSNARVIMGFSGGVDSSTQLAMAYPVLRNRLLALTIDAGHLREGEIDEINATAKLIGAQHIVIDAKRELLEALSVYMYTDKQSSLWKRAISPVVNYVAKNVFGYKGMIDAEEKRRRFKSIYRIIFLREAARFGAEYWMQGTLAPDRIESGATGGAKIKSHHNVGIVSGDLIQLHFFDHLFKYEVRALAKEIGLPEHVCNRQPFPGPGLPLRIVGAPVTEELLDAVRWADARVKEILVRHGEYDKVSQLVVSYIGAKTTGVKGDDRIYGGSCKIRAVNTVDFMTAEGVWFSKEIVEEIKKVIRTNTNFVRVWFDPTDKPPGTTEDE